MQTILSLHTTKQLLMWSIPRNCCHYFSCLALSWFLHFSSILPQTKRSLQSFIFHASTTPSSSTFCSPVLLIRILSKIVWNLHVVSKCPLECAYCLFPFWFCTPLQLDLTWSKTSYSSSILYKWSQFILSFLFSHSQVLFYSTQTHAHAIYPLYFRTCIGKAVSIGIWKIVFLLDRISSRLSRWFLCCSFWTAYFQWKPHVLSNSSKC